MFMINHFVLDSTAISIATKTNAFIGHVARSSGYKNRHYMSITSLFGLDLAAT